MRAKGAQAKLGPKNFVPKQELGNEITKVGRAGLRASRCRKQMVRRTHPTKDFSEQELENEIKNARSHAGAWERNKKADSG